MSAGFGIAGASYARWSEKTTFCMAMAVRLWSASRVTRRSSLALDSSHRLGGLCPDLAECRAASPGDGAWHAWRHPGPLSLRSAVCGAVAGIGCRRWTVRTADAQSEFSHLGDRGR